MDVIKFARNAAFSNLNSIKEELDVVYIFIRDVTDSRNSYKVGMTSDVWRREKDFTTLSPEGRMAFYIPCKNARLVEKTVLATLRKEFRVNGEVVYDISFDMLKTMIISIAASVPGPDVQTLKYATPLHEVQVHNIPSRMQPLVQRLQKATSTPEPLKKAFLLKRTPTVSPYF